MDTNSGFSLGLNVISKGQVLSKLHLTDIHWHAFLWHISSYCKITDFTDEQFSVAIASENGISRLLKGFNDYSPEMSEYNYSVDAADDLWQSHHSGITPLSVLERIL